MTQSQTSRFGRSLLFRLILTAAILALWFWTQSLLGSRKPPAAGIEDALHDLTAGLNAYFCQRPLAANVLLIVSSGFIDALGVFLLCRWLFGGTVRPFLGLILLMALRQVTQALCTLPPPPHMVWHYPGVPSLLVTYNVANDFFFSGHTAIAVFGAMELARLQHRWLTALAVIVIIFEVATVIVLRAHYTMDVFTGIVAALWIAHFSEQIAPPIDRFFSKQTA
jgi:PAP2 superfamily C-terminal